MTQRFLSAAYSRRSAPKTYDPAFINVEMARLAQAMPTYVVRKITSASTVQNNDGMILCDCSTGAIPLTLGDPATASGKPVTIKKTDASSYAVTLSGTIDGTANRLLEDQNASVVIQSDGTSWFRPMLTGLGSTFGDLTANNITTGSVTINTALSGTGELVTYGKIFDNAVWAATHLTVTANSTTAPDGTTTADTLTGTGTDALVVQTLGTVTANRYVLSISVKAGNTATTEYGIYDVTAGSWHLRIRITWTGSSVTGVATVQGAGGDYTYTDQGSGWWLVTGTTTTALNAARTYSYAVYPLAVTVDATGKYIYAWNASATKRINALTVTGPVSIDGAVTLAQTLGVTGATILSSTLAVTGDVTVNTSKVVITASNGNAAFGGLLKSSSPTGGMGYATGAGGTVTQATSKATAFTLSKVTGQITTANDALNADTTVSSTWTNTTIAATDVVSIAHVSGGTIGAYAFNVQCGAGTATLNITNRSTGSLSEALVLQYVVVKGVTA